MIEANLDQYEILEKIDLLGNVLIVQFPEKIFVKFLTFNGEKSNVCSFLCLGDELKEIFEEVLEVTVQYRISLKHMFKEIN